MDSVSSNLILFLISLVICALFSFLETSITALRLFKLKEIERSTTKYRNLFKTFDKDPQHILISILIATNMASVTCAVVSQQLIETLFHRMHMPEGIAFTLGITITAIVVSVVGEIIPKSIAQSLGSKTFTSTLWIINIFYYILGPISSILSKFSQYIAQGTEESDQMVTEKEIHFLINHIEEKGIMEDEKTIMLQNIFRMGKTYVKEILIPKSEIISIDINDDINGLLERFSEHQFSRFPVFQDNPENIIGIVYQKDLFFAMQANSKIKLKDLIRPIIFVPDNLKVNEMLKEFKKQHIHMAMVLDEYGSSIGLVTLEDALEEIVGDIHDEHDDDQSYEKVKEIKKDTEWSIDATIDLDRLKNLLKIKFQSQTSVTLGGFITEQLQHLPKKEEMLFYHGYCFTIEKADRKRVIQVNVKFVEDAKKCKNPTKKKK